MTRSGVLRWVVSLGFLLLLIGRSEAWTTRSESRDLCCSVCLDLDAYSKKYGGKLPPNLKSLFEGERIGTSPQDVLTKVIYFKLPLKLEGSPGEELIATNASPINENGKGEIGRYIVFRTANGGFDSRWEAEEAVQASCRLAGVRLPDVPVVNELVKVGGGKNSYDIRYAYRALADAVKQRDMSAIVGALLPFTTIVIFVWIIVATIRRNRRRGGG